MYSSTVYIGILPLYELFYIVFIAQLSNKKTRKFLNSQIDFSPSAWYSIAIINLMEVITQYN